MKRWLSLLCGIFALSSSAFGQLTPEAGMKTFTVADGLQIELFASEPDVINPTSIDVDEKGRVWVCEAVNYRRKGFGRPILRKEGDRITVLEDTNADGKADKTHVFYQSEEIYGPLGIAVAPYPNPDKKGAISYRVFVCQSPDILVFEDKDGDLKADGPPKKFLTGFRGFDHDHGVHGINIGPDGKLYFTVGDSGVGGLQASDGKGPKFTSNDKDIQKGTVWRCDMDGKNLELIAHNFRNNYECCVNSFGEVWLSDNDDDGNQQTRICFVMPGGNYGYGPRGAGQSHWHEEQPGIVHKVIRTGFGSPTGICFYEGNLLPKKYHGQLLHTDAGPRELRAFHLKPKGAGYEAEKEILVTSTDNWFRLSDVCVAPDSSVILSDWYDPGVGGHGMGDWTRGRIYRVTPKGHKGYKVPEVKLDTKEDHLVALSMPCIAARSFAVSKLIGTTNRMDRVPVIALGLSNGTDGITRGRALWFADNLLVSQIPPKELNEIIRKAYSEDVRLRLQNIRSMVGVCKTEKDLSNAEVQDLLVTHFEIEFGNEIKLANQPNPAVLRELLIALPLLEVKHRIDLFYSLAKRYDGQDHFYRAALNIACGTDPERRDKILADFEKHFPEWNDKVADLVWELRPKSMLPKLEKLLADAKLTGTQKARIIDILAASDDASAGKAMLNLLTGDYPTEVKSRAIDNLKLFLPTKWAALKKSDEVGKTADELMKTPKTALEGMQLIVAADLTDRVDRLEGLAIKAEDATIRKAAIAALGQLKTQRAVDVLEDIIVSEKGFAVDAIAAIGQHIAAPKKGTNASDKALKALQFVVNGDKMPLETKQAALSALSGTQPGSQWLIDVAEKKQLPEALLADAGKLLRNSPYQGLRNRALLIFPPPGKLDPKKLPPISVLATRNGNVERGKQLMAESLKGVTQCLKCHTVRGIGGNIGPDLSMIGKKASKENLFESILQPSKAIADQHVQWQIENSAGQKIIGLLVEDGPAGVTIRDANGKDTKIAKDDIEKRTKSLVSIMPEDIVKGFTEDDLIDVVAYLFTLKTASLTPETWHIAGPFDNDSADKGLDTVYDPEKSKTIDLSAKYKGKGGEVKWTTVKQNGTGYVDLQAFYGLKGTQIASYVYQQIESPVDQEATLLIGNDDGVKIWVNGDLMVTNRDHFAATPERLKIPIKLKKGNNGLLMKIVNGEGPHGFYLSVISEQELKVAPIK